MKAVILNVGDEVLTGKTINTNSSYLAIELEKLSINVEKVIIVGDGMEKIKKEIIDFKNSDYDILITTGGLGPTHDDLTKEAVCEALGLKLEINQKAKEKIERYFNNNAPSSNLKQAYFPSNAIILDNELGTADGAIIPHEGKHYIILVGPPYEMYPMFANGCIKYLKQLQDEETLVKDYIVMGGGESYFEDYLQPILKKLKNVVLNPYASVGKIRYQIKAKKRFSSEFNDVVKRFEDLMADYIVSANEEEVEEVLVKLLINKGYTIAVSESVTGGMIASTLINVSDASKVIKESLVTYSDEAKIKYLAVDKELLKKYSAVSGEVAKAMVYGLKKLTNANICISSTGYAGPSGENDKIGLVYFGIMINDDLYIFEKKFRGNRNMIRQRATLFALFKVLSLVRKISL